VSEHLPSVPAGIAPGVLYLRLVTDTDVVLRTGALWYHDTLSTRARHDAAITHDWLIEHPTGVVYLDLYDGDTGECLHTVIIEHHRDGATQEASP
jgi:hypothetical protein